MKRKTNSNQSHTNGNNILPAHINSMLSNRIFPLSLSFYKKTTNGFITKANMPQEEPILKE